MESIMMTITKTDNGKFIVDGGLYVNAVDTIEEALELIKDNFND